MLTKGELVTALAGYDDDWEVWVTLGGVDGPVTDVDSDPDMKSIVLLSEEA